MCYLRGKDNIRMPSMINVFKLILHHIGHAIKPFIERLYILIKRFTISLLITRQRIFKSVELNNKRTRGNN